LVHEEYPSMTAAGLLLDMTSVADLMDGRLVHTLFRLVLEQKSVGLQGLKLFIIFLTYFILNMNI